MACYRMGGRTVVVRFAAAELTEERAVGGRPVGGRTMARLAGNWRVGGERTGERAIGRQAGIRRTAAEVGRVSGVGKR